MAIIRNILASANTWIASQTFAGSANTAPNQTAASGSSLMTRDLVQNQIAFGGPMIYNIPATAFSTGVSGGGYAENANTTNIIVSNGGTPTAGVSAAFSQTSFSTIPNIARHGAITPGYVDLTTPHYFGFTFLNNLTTAQDAIMRFQLGNPVFVNSVAQGIQYGGYGVKISRFNSSTYNCELYSRTQLSQFNNITAATNASPIVITNVDHRLNNGDKVEIVGVVGNTAANGTWTVANATTNTFELSGSTGNGARTSGGVASKMSSATTFPACSLMRMFIYWDGLGNCSLYFGNTNTSPVCTLSGLSTYAGAVNNRGSIVPQFTFQSVTDVATFRGGTFTCPTLIIP
jgi:hypothetical protein